MILHINKKKGTINISLSSDKDVDFRFNDWPIIWTGLLNSNEIQIVQTQYGNDPSYYVINKAIAEEQKKELIYTIDITLRRVLD